MATTTQSRRNLAAAAAGWSALHRRRTVLGWLAFVILAYAIGTAVGSEQLTDVQMGNGQSKQALAVYQKAFPFHSGEQVLIQGTGSIRTGSPVMTAAVRDLIRRLGALPTVNGIVSPLSS